MGERSVSSVSFTMSSVAGCSSPLAARTMAFEMPRRSGRRNSSRSAKASACATWPEDANASARLSKISACFSVKGASASRMKRSCGAPFSSSGIFARTAFIFSKAASTAASCRPPRRNDSCCIRFASVSAISMGATRSGSQRLHSSTAAATMKSLKGPVPFHFGRHCWAIPSGKADSASLRKSSSPTAMP